MATIKKLTASAVKRGKAEAAEARKVGKSAAKAGAKAGFTAAAAVVAGAVMSRLKNTKAARAEKRNKRIKVGAAVVGAAALTAAGIAVARARSKR